jgi:hypothetical protein
MIKLRMLYPQIVEFPHDEDLEYEEAQYLFSENPGYSRLIEYLTSPLSAARSFAIKHIERAPERVKLLFAPIITNLAARQKISLQRKCEDDLFSLIIKLGLNSSICLLTVIDGLNLEEIYNRNIKNTTAYKILTELINIAKKNVMIWDNYVEFSTVINNIWLNIENLNLKPYESISFSFNFNLPKNFQLSIFPELNITSILPTTYLYHGNSVFLLQSDTGAQKAISFMSCINQPKSAYYYLVYKIILSHLKVSGFENLPKLEKVVCMSLRNKTAYGVISECIEVVAFEDEKIVESCACYMLLLFLLGLKDEGGEMVVGKNNRVVVKPNRLVKAGKHHRYFVLNQKSDLAKVRFYVLSYYICCRDIFENLIWIMNNEIWKNHKLHFYYTMPIMNAISKLNRRILKNTETR